MEGFDTYFRMAQVLGVDKDTGAKVCHGRWQYEVDSATGKKVFPKGADLPAGDHLYLTDGKAKVLLEKDGMPAALIHEFGKGKGIYLSKFEKNNANNRLLLNLILEGLGLSQDQNYLTDNADAECAYYPRSGKLVVINNSDRELTTHVKTEKGVKEFKLQPFETQIVDANN